LEPHSGAQEGLAMSKISGRGSLVAMLSVLTIGAALSVGMAKAADDVTEDQILRALAPTKKPLTRGLSAGPQTQTDPAADAEGKFVQTLRNRPTRSLSATEREEIATITKDKPKIDLEINFGYNSADISAKSLDLAERRADSIKRYLVDKLGIAGTDLVTVGYGKSKLKDPAHPMAEVNRRVQVVNMENKATASK
jgi:outer membrane protein OmpA-like peptidoglycan-associated protein